MKAKVDLKTVQDVNTPKISECPYCGCEEYYERIRYYGEGVFRRRFDGKDAGNEDLYGYAAHKTIGKFAYCCNCDKKIFRIKD